MVQFILQQANSPELKYFPHIDEFALKKVNSISLDSFSNVISECFRLYYIMEGKFEWIINGEHHVLYPTDLAVILPGQELKAEKGYLEIGTLYWLNLHLNIYDQPAHALQEGWNRVFPQELKSIRKILDLNHMPVIPRLPEAGTICNNIKQELFGQEIGYITRVHNLIDDLLILATRNLTQQNIHQRDFPGTFLKLEESLRKDLSHHWTVEEMAALVGLGTTAFSDKVKSFTGFSPMNYLINIRISEAIKLLKKTGLNVTDIALDTGFYSSQHFATTFKKLTGYTPSHFRKKTN